MPRPLVTTLRILLVSANPDDPPLDFDEEFAGILDRLGGHRHVRIQQRTALTMARRQSALLESARTSYTSPATASPATCCCAPRTKIVSAPRSPVDWAIGMATRSYDADAVAFRACQAGRVVRFVDILRTPRGPRRRLLRGPPAPLVPSRVCHPRRRRPRPGPLTRRRPDRRAHALEPHRSLASTHQRPQLPPAHPPPARRRCRQRTSSPTPRPASPARTEWSRHSNLLRPRSESANADWR